MDRPSDLIGRSDLLVLSPSERSDWTIGLVGLEGARRQISGSSNQIAFPGPTSQIVQSDNSDGLRTNNSDRPIRSLGQTQDQQVGSSNQIALTGPTSGTD